MFIKRDEDQEIGYFGSNEKNQTIEIGDQVCLTLEENSEIEVVAEVLDIKPEGYNVKIVEFESDDSVEDLSIEVKQTLEVSSDLIQYCYKKED